jgi:hypothetical protein
VHQCRSLSPHCKVLATAFSNVGADNLAEKFLTLGLKVVRVGKPSGVSEALWAYTLDAAIERDPKAQKALEDAARMTARINKGAKKSGDSRKTDVSAERAKRDAATDAVKASIQVSFHIRLLSPSVFCARAIRPNTFVINLGLQHCGNEGPSRGGCHRRHLYRGR